MTTSPRHTLDLALLQQIVVEAGSAHTVEQQIARLVEQVRHALDVDVCSLYQLDEGQNLHMVANEGLADDIVGRIVLPKGKGLAGHVARSQLPLNVPRAAEHPDFVHFPGGDEDALQAYLGVPIVYLGNVIGVIVVQDSEERAFSAVEESFLITIAAQVAGSLLRLPTLSLREKMQVGRRISGVKGAPGKSIGQLRLVLSNQTLQLIDEPETGNIETELRILSEAIQLTHKSLLKARTRLESRLTEDVLNLFDFYAQMLDGDLNVEAQKRVREGASAFAAVRATVDLHVAAFEAIEDEYFRARGEDVRHVGDQLLETILGQSDELSEAATNLVLLGAMISITDIAQFDQGALAGIVCMQGSALSHTAILARALGLPAVMGTGPIDHIRNGDTLIVDGDLGTIVLNPADALLDAYAAAIEEELTLQQDLLEQKDMPAVTTDGVRLALFANTGLLANIDPGLERGAEGIGLYRSEIPFLTHDTVPTEAEQYDIYRHVLQTYHPMPVTIRTLDIGGDKQLPYLPIVEENPSLGWRGIRFTLDNRSIFVTQLRAILRANDGLGNLRLMLPMISQVAEVTAVAELLNTTLEELAVSGETPPRPPLGIMVEVPGVLPLLPHLIDQLDFVSVGTNDLTQYLLAVDRGNVRVASRYDSLHPGVLHSLVDIIKMCKRLKLDVSVCGEMAGDTVSVVLLVAMGFRSLSMSAASLPRIRRLIRSISLARAQELLADALALQDAQEIRKLIHDALVDEGLAFLLNRKNIEV